METNNISPGTLWFFLSMSGVLLMLTLAIIGFFGKKILSEFKEEIKTMKDDIKDNSRECSENKGRIDLLDQQQQNDIRRIEEMTQMELKVMSSKVSELSEAIKMLVFGDKRLKED